MENNSSAEENENRLKILSELSDLFNDGMKQCEIESEEYWNSLSKEQQLNAFCAVSRRILKGELEDKGSYRHVLYSVFGFGPEAYAQAQMSGYVTIHNAIMTDDHDSLLLESFCKKYNIEDAEKKIADFII